MKKLNYLLVTLLTMLLVVGCSNEEQLPINDGDEALVAFNLELPADGLQTRAIGDGKTVDQLVYEVYEVKEVEEGQDPYSTLYNKKVDAFEGSLKTTLTLALVKGKQYEIAFWAESKDGKHYTTNNLRKVEVNYEGKNNDESRDAFFGTSKKFTVVADQSIDVTLNRPFAQINVGTSTPDYNAAKASGFEVIESSVVINGVANQIDLLTGDVLGTKESITYALSETPKEAKLQLGRLHVPGSKENHYEYLSMSYILVGEDKETLESMKYVFSDGNGQEIELSQGLTNVPVQRNYRTNIIGNLLTDDVDFNIEIDKNFKEPNHDLEIPVVTAESFDVNDKFIGWYKDGETRPNFDAVQENDFGIHSIETDENGVHVIKLQGTVKMRSDTGNYGYSKEDKVAMVVLKYNRPAGFKETADLIYTSPIQSEADFNTNNWGGAKTATYEDGFILTSNIYSLKDNDRLKFAMNWLGNKDEGEGYVEYVLDISEVKFVNVSVNGDFLTARSVSNKLVPATGTLASTKENKVSLGVGLKDTNVTDLSSLKVSIYKEGNYVATMTALFGWGHNHKGQSTSGSLYTGLLSTTSWQADRLLEGKIGDEIFDEYRWVAVKEDGTYHELHVKL